MKTLKFRTMSVPAAAAMALVASGGVMAVGSVESAHAATYQCTSSTNFWHNDSSVDKYITLPTYRGNSSCELRHGAANSGVTVLQRAMTACYALGVKADGSFGPATETALKTLQSRLKIEPDGVYGPITRSAMVWDARTRAGAGAGCWKAVNYI
ncbi:peptidoglycan-binding domain-containing protein [Luteipulveratus flavus]|uniref:Peptidoglycan-binding domain-containing protein n=1 Tax=Luteipulveratus flavus TaxID=3031728 RepID=A0ABT6CB81_9MICO|nr:peptidoglycan-binding domain-containing protein [Luteipulveratus sp. YIM 133296]MDF8266146.1 peptidoglycan-binding domain-containing protein [Luteipulveratus sp. YIM 133296]